MTHENSHPVLIVLAVAVTAQLLAELPLASVSQPQFRISCWES